MAPQIQRQNPDLNLDLHAIRAECAALVGVLANAYYKLPNPLPEWYFRQASSLAFSFQSFCILPVESSES
jgi:hypothetical protein